MYAELLSSAGRNGRLALLVLVCGGWDFSLAESANQRLNISVFLTHRSRRDQQLLETSTQGETAGVMMQHISVTSWSHLHPGYTWNM